MTPSLTPPSHPFRFPRDVQLQSENDASVEAVLAVIESEGWEHVTIKSGVVVVKKFMPPPPRSPSASSKKGDRGVVDEAAAAKFACVKATGTLDAEASEVFSLFLDNERVHVSELAPVVGCGEEGEGR